MVLAAALMHGAIGPYDEIIFIGLMLISLAIIVAGVVFGRNEKDEEENVAEQDNKEEYPKSV
ncbi:MAG: hypothetical protein HY326_11510 [Chloroflexi bacterium]|nr:hypothetical protein [Chloroflexota bacterium]